MEDPHDQVESRNESFIPPTNSHIPKSISSNPSSHNQYYEPRNNINSYTPYNKTENYSNYNNYTPEIIQQFDSNLLPKQKYHPHKSVSNLDDNVKPQQYTHFQNKDYVNDYQQLCYICQQINNRNNTRFHYVYLIIIIFLFLVILMLLKKVLNI